MMLSNPHSIARRAFDIFRFISLMFFLVMIVYGALVEIGSNPIVLFGAFSIFIDFAVLIDRINSSPLAVNIDLKYIEYFLFVILTLKFLAVAFAIYGAILSIYIYPIIWLSGLYVCIVRVVPIVISVMRGESGKIGGYTFN